MPDHHDVLFVVLDSARKDRISAYDHDRETTPALDAIADGATTYENAYTPAPWTLPSHCSFFTGRFPSEHGITNGFTDRSLQLPEEFPTVTERLAEKGYRTAGFSNNPWVGKLSDLNRGFDRFVEWDLEISRSNGEDTHRSRDRLYSKLHTALGRAGGQPHALLKRRFFTSNLVERASRWLSEDDPRPTFTFMNLMEAHSPYYPPRSAFRELDLNPPGPIEPRVLNVRLLAYVLGKADLSPQRRQRVMEFYDASLRYQDRKLGELVERLRAEGRYDDTLLVICADHGKTLGDYDRDATPSHYLRDINVNVPLVVKWPGQREGERVETPVELADLFEVMAGAGDQRLARHEEGALVEDHLPHTGRSATDVDQWRVLADSSGKYVRGEDGQEFLFDRGDGEKLLVPDEADLEPYRERLDRRVDALDSHSRDEEDAEDDLGGSVEKQLEDLGYLNG